MYQRLCATVDNGVVIAVVLTAIVLMTCSLGGCVGAARTECAKYVMVYLKTGPKGAEMTAAERREVFAGQMSNMHRLAATGELLIAGPFAKPTNPAWREILVMNVATTDAAAKLVATDPGVVAGVFATEFVAKRGAVLLREMPRLSRSATRWNVHRSVTGARRSGTCGRL